MAEAIGLTASIIGIAQLAGKTFQVSYNYISSVKTARRDIREFLDELSSLKTVLESLQKVADENPQSEALRQLNKSSGPIERIDGVLKELYIKLDSKDGSKMINRMKWPLKEKETEKCIIMIGRHTTIFNIALSADHMTLSKEIETYTKEMGSTIEEMKSDIRDTALAIYGLKLQSKDTGELVRETNVVIQSLQSEAVAQRLWRQSQITYAESERRKSIINWFYKESFDIKHADIIAMRQPGTGEWFFRRPEFQEWAQKNPNSPILWGYGIPGAGKTFLCSVVIDHFQERKITANYGLAYVYFDYREQEQQGPYQILASLVKQLLFQLIPLPPPVDELYKRLEPHGKRPSLDELYSILKISFTEFDQVFLIFDALDECDQKRQRKALLPLFHRLAQSGTHIFVTSRQHPEDIRDSMSASASIELSPSIEDMRLFIEQRIEENVRARRLVKQGKCKDLIINELIQSAQGMFLLLHFHTEFICGMTNVRLMLRALQSLRDSSNEERPLNPTYDRAMTIIKNQAKGSTTIAMKILSWLVEARRTLSADELREAIAVENNRYELDEWDWTDNAIMLDVCAGLITIDEKSNVIRFVHYTVQEYLIGISLVGDGEKLDIATACATYLSFDVFSEPEQGLYGISDRVRRYPFLAYAGRYLPFHISLCQEDQTAELLLKLFENPGHISSYIQAYDYNGGASLGSDKPFPVQKALHIACWMGHKIVVQTILDNGVDIEAEDFKWERPLYIAAAGGHKEVVKLLLENGADVEAALYNGENPLHVAVLNGHREVVKLLLENGADISARGKDGFLALHIATSTRNEELIRLLLENGSSISAEADGGVTPLHLATKMGNKRLVELFLDLGADVNPVSTSHGETPLHGAVSIAGDAPTVKLLLSRGADIEARSHQGATPLHYAARAGKNEVIELLLDEGAQIDAKDQWGYTSLHHCAASGNRPDVFKLLLDRGADIFSTTPGVPEERHPQSILHSASRNHSESAVPIIQMLLKSGANESLRLEYEDAVLDEGLSKNHQAAHRFMAIMRDAHPFPKFQWQLEVERKQEELRVRRMRENEERYWERERQKKRDQEQDQCGASEESEEDKSEEEESEDESNSIRNDEGPEKECRGWEEQEQRKGEAIAV